VIGSGELRLVPDQAGVIGYVIHPDYWRQGYGAEVARLLLAFGFVAHTLQHISATCDPRNLASARVLEKVGMHDDGCQHKTLLTQDGWRDSALYSIRAQEWSARSG
jgi:RimJ/RimL family protein N-acetyltransferase